MMWTLKQATENDKRVKYICSKDFMKLINYIRKFDKVERVNEYNYTAYDNNDKIYFSIYITEYLDYTPKRK